MSNVKLHPRSTLLTLDSSSLSLNLPSLLLTIPEETKPAVKPIQVLKKHVNSKSYDLF